MLQLGALSARWGSSLKPSVQSPAPSRSSVNRIYSPKPCPSSTSIRRASSSFYLSSGNSAQSLYKHRSSLVATHLNFGQFFSASRSGTRRWISDKASPDANESNKSASNPDSEYFATDDPKTREEILAQAKSFNKMFEEQSRDFFPKDSYEHLARDEKSVFGKYRKSLSDASDVEGMTPSESGIPNSESLRSAHDLKIRRNTVLRKTFWYSFSELAFDARNWRYVLVERKLLVVYALLTAGLLGYALVRPSNDYDFLGKKKYEEEKRRKETEMDSENLGTVASSLLGGAWDAVYEFGANFSLLEPFKKLAYVIGGSIVGLRMLHAMWKGDPLSEDERLIVAHTPLSLAKDLRPDEHHHVSPLLRIMATGHIPIGPWTAVIPPSPWAPHLTLVVETDLLYSIGFNDRGEKVMRKRPFADYFLASIGENAEVILSSASHSKASAKHFFRLFDPYGIASHTFTAEDHRWDGLGWLKPLEERFIGRKPERLVVLDSSYDHCGSMCNNVLRIKPWNGSSTDTTFLELTPIIKYMCAGVEEGMDSRTVIRKYEGSSSAQDVIREQLSYTGIEVPADDPLERRLREKYAKEETEPILLSDAEFTSSMERLANNRVVQPVQS